MTRYQLSRLHEEDGLKTADVLNIARDKKGFLWIATQSAVQRFDGRQVVRQQFPETVNKVMADGAGHVWVHTKNNVYLFDDSLHSFEPVFIDADGKPAVTALFAADNTAAVMAGRQCFRFNQQKKIFAAYPDGSFPPGISISRYFGSHSQWWFFGKADSLVACSATSQQTRAIAFRNYNVAVPVSAHELLVSNTRFKTFYVNLITKEVRLLGSEDKGVNAFGNHLGLFSGLEWKSGQFLLCSNKGLFQYDVRSHAISFPSFYADGRPLENSASVSALYRDAEGVLYFNHADGLFLFDEQRNFIQLLRNYRFASETMPGNDVRNFAEDEEGRIWMASSSGLSWLQPQTGLLKTIPLIPQKNVVGIPSYRQLLNDGDCLWVGTSGVGVWRLEKSTGRWQRPAALQVVGNEDSRFRRLYVWEILKLKSGDILAVGGSSLFLIDSGTMEANLVLSLNTNSVSRAAAQDASGRIWHGTTAGLTCMDTRFKTLFRCVDSFPDKRVAAFCEWKQDRMLVGSKGLFEVVVKGDRIVSFAQKKGMPSEQFIYCMKQDLQGFVWMGTDEGLYRYDPQTDEAILFDRSDHVQTQAFNSDGAILSRSGMLYMGGKNGVNYFNPAAYVHRIQALQPTVLFFGMRAGDSVQYHNGERISYNNREIDLVISAPEYRKPYRVQYRYRLSEDKWIYTQFNNRVRISSLAPGDYGLQVSASYDGGRWFNEAVVLNFTVLKPWWQTTLFRLLCLLLASLAFWRWMHYRRRRRQVQEIKQTIDYFRYSDAAASTVNNIVWDIARNCIAHLRLEDCVIYLLDTERRMLVQKAALGNKSIGPFEIVNPIEIPVGGGITGAAAEAQQTVLVKDTSKDSRYIVDDQQRLSEIAVPIMHQGRLIGVIDSEHRRKNFFTRHHQRTLETIASLCAVKLATAMAVEAVKKAEAELLWLNGQMREARFLNLRLQMNPHFLFNILTTIQYLIVSKQVEMASKYLDIFSGFLRSLLNHAEDTVVTLAEELRILSLYVELESLCLDETFIWSIRVSEGIDTEEVLVPFMLLQPFVENAINHGLIHKVGEKRFSITVSELDDEHIVCNIEDNGVGRQASARINEKKLARVLHQSKGISIVAQRLQLLQQKTARQAGFEIEDLYINGAASGTRIRLVIPCYSNEEV